MASTLKDMMDKVEVVAQSAELEGYVRAMLEVMEFLLKHPEATREDISEFIHSRPEVQPK